FLTSRVLDLERCCCLNHYQYNGRVYLLTYTLSQGHLQLFSTGRLYRGWNNKLSTIQLSSTFRYLLSRAGVSIDCSVIV
ncbi:hypothetical protein LSH36_898g00109, partial [Paralvinella palmiformis]